MTSRKQEALVAMRAIERLRGSKDVVVYISPEEEHCIFLLGFGGIITCENNILYWRNQPFEVVNKHDKKYIKSAEFDKTEQGIKALESHGLSDD